mgnify:CR=1 FL=1
MHREQNTISVSWAAWWRVYGFQTQEIQILECSYEIEISDCEISEISFYVIFLRLSF